MKDKLTISKTIKAIAIYFLLFLAGDLLSSLPCDLLFTFIKLPYSELYAIVRTMACLLLTIFLFWFYTTKCLRFKMKDFGITFELKKWGIIFSILLPLFVVSVFFVIGETKVNTFAIGELLLVIFSSILIALKAGILEEMLFRGFIMRLLENRWNKFVAILVPSFVFSLVHIPSMEDFSGISLFLLIASGTLVGVMFSLVAYVGQSVNNSILLHSMWNFVMVTSIFRITTEQAAYGEPIFSIILFTDNPLLTGAGFGVEASIISIIGYALICIAAGFIWKHKQEN